MLTYNKWTSKPKLARDLELLILRGRKVQVPDEYWEHLYKKEYGISTLEYMEEPVDRIETFKLIKYLEAEKEKKDNRGKL